MQNVIDYRLKKVEVVVEFKLQPTESQLVYLGIGHPSGAHHQIFYLLSDNCGFFYVGAPSLTRG
jgi:hypothetical protein